MFIRSNGNIKLETFETELLNPKKTWSDPCQYDMTASKLVEMFKQNYSKYQIPEFTDYSIYGPL
jgi:ATP-dependent phosphoenolpyruvate carboxykinase